MPHRPSVLVSIHDVMPATLAAVEALLDRLDRLRITPATLLVVPGCDWRPSQIEALKRRHRQGCRLAGHGWHHRCRPPRGIYHRLHSAVLSRDVAEHLSCDESGIAGIMSACHRWFAAHDLPPPDLYVPPAWALGAVSGAVLTQLPFRFVETLTGVRDTRRRRRHRLPLAGFEADTRLRAGLLRGVNALNHRWAASRRLPLRLAIHPHDPSLHMARDLDRLLQRPLRVLDLAVVSAR